MELYEKMLSSEGIFDGHVIKVTRDKVSLPNGDTSVREVVRHRGAVAVIALDDDMNVVVVNQYRYALGKVLTEIPAGKLEAGEDPDESAVRELREETGCTAKEMIRLGKLYSSPGFCDEVLYLYLARGLEKGEQQLDFDEFLTADKLPLDELVDKIMAGEISDGKTVAGVLKAREFIKSSN